MYRKVEMKTMKAFFCLLTGLLCGLSLYGQSHSQLWYEQAAEYFEESLVLGNGKMGASVFGGVHTDKIYLNDASLWAGEPVNPRMNPEAYKALPAIREALAAENYPLADSLNRQLQGSFSQSFAPLGTLFLNMKHEGEAQAYRRTLDISQAISSLSYEIEGVRYNREYLISYPDQVMAIHLEASEAGALSFDLSFNSLLKYQVSIEEETFKANGYAPYHAEPSYRGDIAQAVQFDAKRGTRFSNWIRIHQEGGQIVQGDSSLGLTGGKEATILISIATSFNGFDKNPATEGLDAQRLAKKSLSLAWEKSYAELKMAHLEDYQTFFDRVSLNLGESTAPDLPTDQRLMRYAEGKEDKNLEILYFQFGRYLLISSSRSPGIPANLQGIWNPYIRPPWSSNYTVNINLEENYWLAENTQLPEMHQPLLSFIENLAQTGKVTAQTFYGVDRGWVACHNSDIWAMSNPVGDFGKGHPVWANWNMGGTWLSTHLWEHFLFNQDDQYLSDQAYPLMKGAAEFCLDWMVEDKKGNLITSPSTSPENIYISSEGYHGATLYGSTADLAIIRECFSQTLSAARRLKVDKDLQQELSTALERMHPYQIGSQGHLQEWYHDWEDQDPQHRHQSQLFGLYPGHQINPMRTPELAKACSTSLEIKGDETTGWSKGWRINLWARLWDGNRAYKMYRELLRYVEPDNKPGRLGNHGGTYPNLLDAHPPFQIDGNFGGAAAVAEMLLQSSEEEIRLLPASPDAWDRGSVKGLCARGGFVVDMHWADGEVTEVEVSSEKGGKTRLIYGDKVIELNLRPGESVKL